MLPLSMGLTGVKRLFPCMSNAAGYVQEAASAKQRDGCEELSEERDTALGCRAGSSKRKGKSSQSIPASAATQGKRIFHTSASSMHSNNCFLKQPQMYKDKMQAHASLTATWPKNPLRCTQSGRFDSKALCPHNSNRLNILKQPFIAHLSCPSPLLQLQTC